MAPSESGHIWQMWRAWPFDAEVGRRKIQKEECSCCLKSAIVLFVFRVLVCDRHGWGQMAACVTESDECKHHCCQKFCKIRFSLPCWRFLCHKWNAMKRVKEEVFNLSEREESFIPFWMITLWILVVARVAASLMLIKIVCVEGLGCSGGEEERDEGELAQDTTSCEKFSWSWVCSLFPLVWNILIRSEGCTVNSAETCVIMLNTKTISEQQKPCAWTIARVWQMLYSPLDLLRARRLRTNVLELSSVWSSNACSATRHVFNGLRERRCLQMFSPRAWTR